MSAPGVLAAIADQLDARAAAKEALTVTEMALLAQTIGLLAADWAMTQRLSARPRVVLGDDLAAPPDDAA